MVSVDWEISIYPEVFERCLKWYSLAFKDKHPSKEDEKTYHFFSLLLDDMRRAEKEESEDE